MSLGLAPVLIQKRIYAVKEKRHQTPGLWTGTGPLVIWYRSTVKELYKF